MFRKVRGACRIDNLKDLRKSEFMGPSCGPKPEKFTTVKSTSIKHRVYISLTEVSYIGFSWWLKEEIGTEAMGSIRRRGRPGPGRELANRMSSKVLQSKSCFIYCF